MKKLIMAAILVVTVSLAQIVKGQNATNAGTETTPTQKLPLRLPIGSELEVRNYIVASNGLAMNEDVSLCYFDILGNYTGIQVGINRQGYASYEAFLDDMMVGADILLQDFLNKGSDVSDYVPGSDIYASVEVLYFCDSTVAPVSGSLGLAIDQNIGPLQVVTLDKIRQAFSISTSNKVSSERIIMSFPTLINFETVIELPGKGSNYFGWNLASGVRKSSDWPNIPYNGTTQGWVVIDKFASVGTNAASFTIGLADGQKATYTHKGDMIVAPEVNVAPGAKTVNLKVPRGADVTVYSSSNLKDWSVFNSFNSGTSSNISLPIGTGLVKQSKMMFFGASCKAYGQQ